ncbi:DUF667 domain-containing protein, partial [Nephila pilipes]
VLDDTGTRRSLYYNDYQLTTEIEEFTCTRRLIVNDGWNIINLDLADITRIAFGRKYVETLRVKIHANLRVNMIYFCERLYSDEELSKIPMAV